MGAVSPEMTGRGEGSADLGSAPCMKALKEKQQQDQRATWSQEALGARRPCWRETERQATRLFLLVMRSPTPTPGTGEPGWGCSIQAQGHIPRVLGDAA